MSTQKSRLDLFTSASEHCSAPLGRYRAVVLVAPDGQRTCTVVDPAGALWLPASIYLSVDRLPSVDSRNTLESNAHSIAKLTNACADEGIDIVNRVRTGKFLSKGERSRVVARMGRGVGRATLATYLSDGLGFLRFVVDVQEERMEPGVAADRFARRSEKFFQGFSGVTRRPSRGDSPRQPLTGEAREEFERIIDSQTACERVWPDRYVAMRNRTFMKVALLEGHRRDELLNLKKSDVDFATGSYRIERRPGGADPRRRKPLVKGYSRNLNMLPECQGSLVQLVRERDKRPLAGSHDFVFTTPGGAPLSRGAVNAAFRRFRREYPIVGPGFCPHVLRHSWNDAFSVYADEVGLAPEREIRARKYKMGWRSSSSAAAYTGRHDRAVADEVSLLMQAAFLKRLGRS